MRKAGLAVALALAVVGGVAACGVPREVVDSYQSAYDQEQTVRTQLGDARAWAQKVYDGSQGKVSDADEKTRQELQAAITQTDSAWQTKIPDNVQSGEAKPTKDDFESAQSGLVALTLTDQDATTLLRKATSAVENAMMTQARSTFDAANTDLGKALDEGAAKLSGTTDDTVADPQTRVALSKAIDAATAVHKAAAPTCSVDGAQSGDTAQSGAQSGVVPRSGTVAQSGDMAQSGNSAQAGDVFTCVTSFEKASKERTDQAAAVRAATAAVQQSADAKTEADRIAAEQAAAAAAAAAQQQTDNTGWSDTSGWSGGGYDNTSQAPATGSAGGGGGWTPPKPGGITGTPSTEAPCDWVQLGEGGYCK